MADLETLPRHVTVVQCTHPHRLLRPPVAPTPAREAHSHGRLHRHRPHPASADDRLHRYRYILPRIRGQPDPIPLLPRRSSQFRQTQTIGRQQHSRLHRAGAEAHTPYLLAAPTVPIGPIGITGRCTQPRQGRAGPAHCRGATPPTRRRLLVIPHPGPVTQRQYRPALRDAPRRQGGIIIDRDHEAVRRLVVAVAGRHLHRQPAHVVLAGRAGEGAFARVEAEPGGQGCVVLLRSPVGQGGRIGVREGICRERVAEGRAGHGPLVRDGLCPRGGLTAHGGTPIRQPGTHHAPRATRGPYSGAHLDGICSVTV